MLDAPCAQLLHQIEHAGEHSWTTPHRFVLLQTRVEDIACPPPLTPPTQAPFVTKGQQAPSQAGTLFISPHTSVHTPASALYCNPAPDPQGTLPLVSKCCAAPVVVVVFTWLPAEYNMLHDALWWPKTQRCGGTVAIFRPRGQRYHVQCGHIPLPLDNPYTMELYTAKVALSARGGAANPTFVFRTTAWHFANNLYIMAHEGRTEPEDTLQGDPVQAC